MMCPPIALPPALGRSGGGGGGGAFRPPQRHRPAQSAAKVLHLVPGPDAGGCSPTLPPAPPRAARPRTRCTRCRLSLLVLLPRHLLALVGRQVLHPARDRGRDKRRDGQIGARNRPIGPRSARRPACFGRRPVSDLSQSDRDNRDTGTASRNVRFSAALRCPGPPSSLSRPAGTGTAAGTADGRAVSRCPGLSFDRDSLTGTA